MSDDKQFDLLIEQFKMAHELHKHEDNLVWQKFNYFIAVNGTLIGVLAATWKDLGHYPYFFPKLFSMFGVAISLGWLWVTARGLGYHAMRVKQARWAEDLLIGSTSHRLAIYRRDLEEYCPPDRIIPLEPEGIPEQYRISHVPFSDIPSKKILLSLPFLAFVMWLVLLIVFMTSQCNHGLVCA